MEGKKVRREKNMSKYSVNKLVIHFWPQWTDHELYVHTDRRMRIWSPNRCVLYDDYTKSYTLWRSYALVSLQNLYWEMTAQSVQWLGHGLEDRGSIPGRGNDGIFFSSSPRSDWPWGPPRGALTPGIKRGWGVKLTIYLYIVLRLRMHGTIPPIPHGMVLS
jgi:hypothetical protein